MDVDDPVAVAPLTPEVTAAIGPEFLIPMSGGGQLNQRADWSYRDDMFGEPTADPGRFTQIDSRSLINFDFTYEPPDADWTLRLYRPQRHRRALRQRAPEHRRLHPADPQ